MENRIIKTALGWGTCSRCGNPVEKGQRINSIGRTHEGCTTPRTTTGNLPHGAWLCLGVMPELAERTWHDVDVTVPAAVERIVERQVIIEPEPTGTDLDVADLVDAQWPRFNDDELAGIAVGMFPAWVLGELADFCGGDAPRDMIKNHAVALMQRAAIEVAA